MNLQQAIAEAGLTPPRELVSGRWLRFPGIGKGRSNRSGWCRIVSPTLAIFGDWSSGMTATWRDDTHEDNARNRALLEQARRREREFAAQQRARAEQAASRSSSLLQQAALAPHPYLVAKGFPELTGLVHEGKLLIPVRDATDYQHLMSVQTIAADGTKLFLPGGRTRGGIYRFGPAAARRTVLCEGYATGLTLHAALARLPGPHAVIVCFSANNLELVAKSFQYALVCADNDVSGTGQQAAARTGLRWVMPPIEGEDFNDLHQRCGLHAVTELLRTLP